MRSIHSKKPTVLIPPSVADSNLPATILLQAGNRSLSVHAKLDDNSGDKKPVNRLELPPYIARLLAIPAYSYRILRYDDHSIRIGPIVGILTAGKPGETAASEKTVRRYKQLILQGWARGIFVYCFLPQAISWNRGFIYGHTCTPNGKWLKGYFAIPDVVYNRILYRSTENQKLVQKMLEEFDENPGVYLFNRRFLNKWEVALALAQNPQTRQWIPETDIFSSTNLKSFLQRHQELFLKPCHNSRGQGIVKIERTSNNGYRYGRTEWKGKHWIYAPTPNLLAMRLRQNLKHPRQYIIQQGVDLARLDGRVFDLRAQAQKNRQGQWILTGVGVRIAARNRFVTHVPNGGSRAEFYNVIREVFNSPQIQKSIEQELYKICTIVQAVLEQELNIPLGILSLDIGVDSSARLWILEINSKPARFDEDDIRQRHTQLLLDYFIFAAEHNSKGR